ncbi:tripartite tricarboxylate transporter TctB family protein [Salinicoccus sp. ID82-1]|uniref:tripartite tricarboxylate transporter TctB family protein n=1 Tax=Salinicoccus sp. ID82-1 TaxID=2820269 RepID=UPI00351D859C|nr:tripartite tricarboxylate transporter TctB family protein [Salinicoccus sp. ID82-1]
MKNLRIIVSTFLLITFSFLFWQTFQFKTSFASQGVGPAFFPRVTLLILIVLNVIEIASAVKYDSKGESRKLINKQLLLFVAVILLFVGLFSNFPFLIVSIVTLFLMSIILKLKLIPSLLFSVAISLTVYLIFTEGFNIIL